MKNSVKLSIILLVFVFASCKDNKVETKTEVTSEKTADNQLYSCPMHPKVTGDKGEACSVCGMSLSEPVVEAQTAVEVVKEVEIIKSKSSFSIDRILNNYLSVKNALTKDDSKGAAQAAKELFSTLKNTKGDQVEAALQAQYATIVDGATKQAEQISSGTANIEKQRKDFALLSKDMHDLIAMFTTDKKLYQDYCPMYDQGKSGYWISEIKDIKNPYYGSEMLTCGGITKEL